MLMQITDHGPHTPIQAWVNDFGVSREGYGEVKHHRSLNVFYLVGTVIDDFVRKLILYALGGGIKA